MITIVFPVLSTLLRLLRSRTLLHLEILALRQQLVMLNQTSRKRPRFRNHERLFWVWLYRLWPGCLQTLKIFKPDTLVRWHRKGFRLYWTWKSRCRRGGRPPIAPEVRELIRTMSRDNVGWGVPRIHGELMMLGINVSQATVAKYMIRHRKPPSQTWRKFLNKHAKELVSIDFFTVPTATFRILYVLLVLSHERRQVVHLNITENPTAIWAAQQMIEAFSNKHCVLILITITRHVHIYHSTNSVPMYGKYNHPNKATLSRFHTSVAFTMNTSDTLPKLHPRIWHRNRVESLGRKHPAK
jgi:putative transposase